LASIVYARIRISKCTRAVGSGRRGSSLAVDFPDDMVIVLRECSAASLLQLPDIQLISVPILARDMLLVSYG